MREALKKGNQRGRGRPQRTADMWFRDLVDSVRVLSQTPEAQQAILRNWQMKTNGQAERFQFEWGQFKRIHHRVLPLNVAERLDWLARLTSALPTDSSLSNPAWKEVRQVAADAVAMMNKR